MADFEIAVTKTIANEGDKYTETPGDSGGATKYGISLRFILAEFNKNPKIYPGNSPGSTIILSTPTDETIKNLTLDVAKLIYKKYFWDANRYGEIEDQEIANKVFDMAVLIGSYNSNYKLQLALFNLSQNFKKDGIIGDITLEHVNKIVQNNIYCFINKLKIFYTKYFLSLVKKDKSQEKFLLGWLNRVLS